jgi:phosphoglycerol transferase
MNKLVRYLVCYITGVLFLMPYWIHVTFGTGITVEQMLFHLLSGAEGLEGTDIGLKKSFVLNILLFPLAFPAILGLLELLITKFTDPDSRRPQSKAINSGIALLLVSAAAIFAYRIDLPQYITSRFGQDTFSSLYADPRKINFRVPKHKKNLLFIYVESLENKMADLGPDHINAIAPIEALPGYRVPNFIQAPGTGWSIAGVIASQAGIPLKPFYWNDVGSYAKNGYFPNLVSLGDILSRNGYVQYFLTGPDINFSGMNKFFNSHGSNYVIGRDEWRARGVDESLFDGWGSGLHDDTLLDEAYKVIRSCREGGKPFAITIMTIDSHFPDGFPSPRSAPEERAGGFIGAFKYTSGYLSRFINRLIAEGILDTTDIVIMGDHLFMSSSEQEGSYFNYSENRRVFFKVISSDPRLPKRTTMTHYDVAPTILDLLGMLRKHNTWYGLGISLFATIPDQVYKKHLEQVMDDKILSPSAVYDQFWTKRR